MENEQEFEKTENGERIFSVPEANLPVLRERIAKLNKRAAKLGCAEIIITVLSEYEIELKKTNVFGEKESIFRKMFKLTVTGAAPKINGWEFIAVIQQAMDEEGKSLGNILRGVPGASSEVPVEYRTATLKCEHCNTDRRRNETFVLKHEAGETKQVGRNCLRDFLGHTSPESFAAMAQILLDASDLAAGSEDDDYFGGVRHIDRYAAEEVLVLAACSVRLNGWRSNATAREFGTTSTSGEVSNWLFAKADERKKWMKPLEATDEDRATAKEVTEWLASLSSRTELNDYLYNLSVLGQAATFTTKNFGLACSAIPTYLREMEREINRRKRFAEDSASQHFGTEGARIEKMDLTLVFTRDIEKEGYAYGRGTVTHMYKFKDAAGNVAVWFASNVYWNPATQQDINIGDTVSLTGTVKKHDEYNGVKQTIITRCAPYVSKEEKKAAAKARKAERDAARKAAEENDVDRGDATKTA